MERANSHHAVWHEFLNLLRILNMEVHKEFVQDLHHEVLHIGDC